MSDSLDTSCLPLAALDTSRSPPENTATRLPAPSQQKFCDSCNAFLQGDRTEYADPDHAENLPEYPQYIHHPDAISFQAALELPCDICIRMHQAFHRTYEIFTHGTYLIGPTRYMFSCREVYPNRRSTRFSSHAHHVWSDLVPYKSRPDLHHQHITKNTGDTRALSFFIKQYNRCRKQHSKCQYLAPFNSFMPTRAIYVGSTEEDVVRLCERVDITTKSTYSVLSHCWGKHPQQVVLTKSTVQMLKDGIAWSSLPKTFQDAIVVTRKFRIEYIWIDSLCIFQDDIHDWAVEASRMRDVYSKADICIAATAAESGDVGLFFDRDVQELTPVVVEVRWLKPVVCLFGFHSIREEFIVGGSPLNRRAWVAQERFLSPRILHFTQALLFWECHTSSTNENKTNADIDPMSIEAKSDCTVLKRLINDLRWPGSSIRSTLDPTPHSISNGTKLTTPRRMYRSWCEFLSDYTTCNLTKEADVLVALVGIADEVGHVMSDSLIAGLWKAHFIEEMCWRPTCKPRRPSSWRAPSWSWASTEGRIQTAATKELGQYSSHYGLPSDMATVNELYISTNLSGQVEQGSVLLECRPVPASLRYADTSFGDACCTLDKSIWPSLTEELSDGDLIGGSYGLFGVTLDDPDALCYHSHRVIDVQLLVLLRFDPTDYPMVLEGICVVCSGNQANAFERIGHFYLTFDAAKLVLAAYEQSWVQTISLL